MDSSFCWTGGFCSNDLVEEDEPESPALRPPEMPHAPSPADIAARLTADMSARRETHAFIAAPFPLNVTTHQAYCHTLGCIWQQTGTAAIFRPNSPRTLSSNPQRTARCARRHHKDKMHKDKLYMHKNTPTRSPSGNIASTTTQSGGKPKKCTMKQVPIHPKAGQETLE